MFSQSGRSSHSLDIIFCRAEVLILMKSNLAIFLSLIVPLVFYLRSRHYTKSRLGFLLRYLLGLL